MSANYDELLRLIQEIVDMQGVTWKEKRDRVLSRASLEQRMAVEEFASWFEVDDK